MKRNRGLTHIELLVAIFILVILVLILFPNVNHVHGQRRRMREQDGYPIDKRNR